MCIRYELKKITGDIGLWMVIVMCLIINGFVIIRICADKLPNYLSLYANNESDYDDIINNAYENMESGSDIVYMQEIINSFEAREWNFEAYDSREKDYVEHNLSSLLVAVICILITIKIIDQERTGNMTSLICATKGSYKGVFLTKLIVTVIVTFVVTVIFFLVDLILYAVGGGVNIFNKLYIVPGYFTTWFMGNVLEYKLGYMFMTLLNALILTGITYLLSMTIRKTAPVICVAFVGAFVTYKFIEYDKLFTVYERTGIKIEQWLVIGGVSVLLITFFNVLIGLKRARI